MPHIFISHASADDAFVAELRKALEAHNLTVWVDSRNLRGGSKLQPNIEQALQDARQVIAVLSLQTVNSPWVRKEIQYALQVEQTRQADGYRIIPLLLPGMKPEALGNWFDEEPVAVPIELKPGGLSEALPAILAALGERLPTDKPPVTQVAVQPVDELVLELRDPTLHSRGGTQRARATAILVYQPADPVRHPVESQRYAFIAPLGPIELEEVRWYLEEYNLWPTGVFQQRAERTETQLPEWGKALYTAALGTDAARAALTAWQTASGATRRISIKVERELPEGTNQKKQAAANEAASQLLALPWELLHDERGYLLHGRHAAHIRRQLPNREPRERQLATLPVRVLLVSPRPDDVTYLDHRASALPLMTAVENLGDLVTLTLLAPPTLKALETELQRAAEAKQPYTVVHFDGHGVYDRQQGLGALCFEAPPNAGPGDKRPLDLVHADRMANLMRDYGIPLVFLDACQTAQVETDPTSSVAARLLEEGVTSVVAMRNSVLVETAQRFVQAFYTALAMGKRVGEALLAGQQALKNDTWRGKIMGAGELRLHDWFVPVLYQEQPDPQLFAQLPSAEASRLQEQRRRLALVALPATPPHTFVGRSRELLALERLLATQPYVVVRGTGGAGKTTIAVELARWLVRSGRMRRAAFISLEQCRDDRSVLDALGHQLLPDGDKYSVAQYPNLKRALQPVERALADQATVIVIDNVESVLPEDRGQKSEDSEQAASEGIWALCQQLLQADPATRLVFTSRERLPAPFNVGVATRELGALERREAIQLVERVMANEGWTPPTSDAGQTAQEVIDLVEAVHCHARALVLLAREVARRGVAVTTKNLHTIMAELERKYPGDPQNSLYASVELSLRHLPPETRGRVNALAVCHGGVDLYVMSQIMEVDDLKIVHAIATTLLGMGLAEIMKYGYLRLDPALPPYLLGNLAADAVETLHNHWAAAMIDLTNFLYQQLSRDAQLATQLTLLELPNLQALLIWLQGHAPLEQIVDVAGSIEQLLEFLGQPAALAQAVAVREAAAKVMDGWGSVQFNAERLRIERLLQAGDLRAAYTAAEALRKLSLAARETAYEGATYDIAIAHFLLGRVLRIEGRVGMALGPLAEARRCFEVLTAENGSAARMAGKSINEQADCLSALGQLDKAVAAYEESIKRAKQFNDRRQIAINSVQLGTVYLHQKRYDAALAVYQDALTIFDQLNEPGMIATLWHQIGYAHREAGNTDAAERAYRQALALNVQYGNLTLQAGNLAELGNLYSTVNRPEEAVTFYHQAIEIYVALGDQRCEGVTYNNIASTLVKLGRYIEARTAITRAIEYAKSFGHAAEPWKAWNVLHGIEEASGDAAAAQRAWQQTRDSYLAYRRDGGYVQTGTGVFCEQLLQYLQAGDRQSAETYLAQEGKRGWSEALLAKLQTIVQGARDPALCDDQTLYPGDAAEVLLLVERLG